MTDPDQQEDRDELGPSAAGLPNGAAPQQVDFPGADEPPPGRPDGDDDPGSDELDSDTATEDDSTEA